MSVKAKAIKTLYRMKRIDINGVREAVSNKVITTDEFKEITGKEYHEITE